MSKEKNPFRLNSVFCKDLALLEKLKVTVREPAAEVSRVVAEIFPRESEFARKAIENEINKAALDVIRLSTERLQSASPEPPRWAEGVLVVLAGSTKRGQAMHGDLCERFARDCAIMSPQRARFLFVARVAASLTPLLGRTIGRVVKWTAVLSAAKRFFIG